MKNRPADDPSSPSVEELLDLAEEAEVRQVFWERGDRRVSFVRNGPGDAHPAGPAGAPPPPPAPAARRFILSPIVGTFLRAPSDRPPLVVEGDHVTPGQRVAIVEAMRVPRDVIADVGGVIARVLVENGRPAEYGQPLFEIDPSGTVDRV